MRSTGHDDLLDDAATYDSAVHDDAAVAAAHDPAAYDTTSAGPGNGHTGNVGTVYHAC